MNGEIYGKLQHERQVSYVDQWKLIDSRRNEKDNEMGYYPIVELKIVLRQPEINSFSPITSIHNNFFERKNHANHR
jgi:hypothetical protein